MIMHVLNIFIHGRVHLMMILQDANCVQDAYKCPRREFIMPVSPSNQ